MIILKYDPLDHLEADQFLSEQIYVSINRSLELRDANEHLVHTISKEVWDG